MRMNLNIHKSKNNKFISGLAGGIAESLDLEPLLVRTLFVILTIPLGIGIILYTILWAFINEREEYSDIS